MTAAAVHSPVPAAGVTAFVGAAMAVFRRSVREGARDPGPALFLPALPSVLMSVAFTSQFERLIEVVDLPTATFAEYVVPGLIVVVALASGGFTSASLAIDLRSGFMDRLRLYRLGVQPLLIGRFIYEAVRVVPGMLAVIVVGLLAGGDNENGLGGVVVILALGALLSAAFAGLHLVVATASQDPNTPLNLQPVGVMVFFLSSAIVPPAAMPAWAESVAAWNPVSAVADAGRAAFLGDLWGSEVWTGFAVAGAWLAVSVVASTALVSRTLNRG